MKKDFFKLLTVLLLLSGCAKKSSITGNNQEDNPAPSNQPQEEATAVVNAGTVQQNIRGFGGASIRGWIADLTSAQRTTAFSTSSGIGLSVLRVRVSPNSSDFALEKPTIDAAKSFGATV